MTPVTVHQAPGRSPDSLPATLAEVHRAAPAGTTLRLVVAAEGPRSHDPPGSDPTRPPAAWNVAHLTDVVIGAGFDAVAVAEETTIHGRVLVARATRARTLPDTVGPDMRLLVCGLNPSVYAADAGVGFARPGNRFWPAALAAGLVTRDRDPWHALGAHGVGVTDLVKRATPRADALTATEYRDGLARVERLVAWLRPGAVCFVGLAGWRAAADRRATAGPQPERLAGVPVHVMPSTSGANARVAPAELIDHLCAAACRADAELIRRRGRP